MIVVVFLLGVITGFGLAYFLLFLAARSEELMRDRTFLIPPNADIVDNIGSRTGKG